MRRAVGVVVLGLLWMAIWGAIGASISIVAGIIDPRVVDAGEGPGDMARIMGPVGGASGILFGLLLLVGKRGANVGDIGFLHAIVWGVVAAAAVRLFTNLSDAVLWNIVVLGAVSASLSVALARVTRRRVSTGQQGSSGSELAPGK
jgi:hypothetical protein